jgi:group I intron endonuclease
MNVCTIYIVTNKINGKRYVGQTWNTLHRRWLNHCSNKGCLKLYNSIQKNGRDNFSLEFLTIVHTQEIADYWEGFFIRKYDTINKGYNIREGGSRGKVSDETKKKMSSWQIGRKLSSEHRSNVSKARMGMKPSEKTRLKLSEVRKGNRNGFAPGHKSGNQKGKTWKLINGKRVYSDQTVHG